MGEWEPNVAPSCVHDGYETRKCTACNYSENRGVPATGHDYVAVVTPPTCMGQGYTTHNSANCNDRYIDAYTDPTGHSFGDWQVQTEPDCVVPGSEICYCTGCGMSQTRQIPAYGHDYEIVVTEPTCTEGGYTTYTCRTCGESFTCDETEATGHDWQITVTESTCTEGGYTTYTCRTCATSFRINETEALGHDYIDGSCTRCGAAEPVTFADVPADSFYHEPVQWAVEQGSTAGTGEGTFSPCGDLPLARRGLPGAGIYRQSLYGCDRG